MAFLKSESERKLPKQVPKLLQKSLQMFENKIELGLTHFGHQFIFISGSLKNDVHTHVSHIKLQTSITQR